MGAIAAVDQDDETVQDDRVIGHLPMDRLRRARSVIDGFPPPERARARDPEL